MTLKNHLHAVIDNFSRRILAWRVAHYANYLVWFEEGRTEWLRATGWSYREIELDGIALPVIEAHCEYRQPARYDDDTEIRTRAGLLTPIRIRFDYEVVARRSVCGCVGLHRSRGAGCDGAALPIAGARHGDAAVKALVTGAAGFIGSHLSETLLDSGVTVTGIDAFTDYYPRERKEANLASLRQRPGFTLVESSLADADLPGLLEGVTHVFHLAAQAGVRKSWGRDFHVYTVSNVEGTQVLLEACAGRPIERFVYASSSSVYGDDVAVPMREDAGHNLFLPTV